MMMMMLMSVIVIASIVTARVDTVHANDHLTLDITCKDHMIKVIIRAAAPTSFQSLILDSCTNSGPFLRHNVHTAKQFPQTRTRSKLLQIRRARKT